MFTKKIKQLIFALLTLQLIACTSNKQDPFEQAVFEAKLSKKTEVNKVKNTVPFYSVNTLDPNWEESGSTPIVKIPEMKLTDQNGKVQTQDLFNDKISVVAFFFTSCAGFCPTLLKNLQLVETRLKSFKNIQYIGISVDPETDQPKELKAYIKHMKFNEKTWTLLTGDRDFIYKMAREDFASEAFRLVKSKGQVAHSEHFYFFDPKHRLRGVLKGTRLDVPEKSFQLVSALEKELEANPTEALVSSN